MNDKIEYDLEENNRDKMGELKIKSRINNNSSSKRNEFETEDDDINFLNFIYRINFNIDTDIGK